MSIELILTGRTDRHIHREDKTLHPIHVDAHQAFLRLREKAKAAGFELRSTSCFRDFDRQLGIWNRKATGQQNVLDDESNVIDISKLNELELCHAILRFSALPGGTRHHWGTDIDVFDENCRPEDYEVQLIPQECGPKGMFGDLHIWLDEMITNNESEGFFRPYQVDQNGVAPEMWHLSYAPVSVPYYQQYSIDLIRETIEQAQIELKQTILDNLDDFYQRYIMNIVAPPFKI